MSKLPKTKKGMETFIRKIVQQELDERADADTGVVQALSPQELQAQKRQEEIDAMYDGVADMPYRTGGKGYTGEGIKAFDADGKEIA